MLSIQHLNHSRGIGLPPFTANYNNMLNMCLSRFKQPRRDRTTLALVTQKYTGKHQEGCLVYLVQSTTN